MKQARTKSKQCKDCVASGITTNRRVVPGSGGRCATHHRQRQKELKERNHAKHIAKTYGLTPEEYMEIYRYQGGKCYICERATGARKKLAVDHDHKTGFVRGLLCGTCNRKVLGHLRDDPLAFKRGMNYLNNPPAFDIIGHRKVPEL